MPSDLATKSLRDRLTDSSEIFSQPEVHEAFEELAQMYGYYKLPQAPVGGSGNYTEPLTVKGFEHIGSISVRPVNQRDEMIDIPCLIDELLKDHPNAGNSGYSNAYALALAKTVIVSPIGLVDALLDTDDPRDIGFFRAFNLQYRQWQNERAKVAREKKSGMVAKANGSEFATSSENEGESSQPTETGLT